MIKAAIFDMDGLLIDSEPLWEKSETEIYTLRGISFSPEMYKLTKGLRIDEKVRFWNKKFPWALTELKEVEDEITDRVIQNIKTDGHAFPGVHSSLELLKKMGIRIGLASSSTFRIIEVVMKKLDLANYIEVIHSAELEEYGKPHPAIYISSAKMMNIPPCDCLALEDSINGIIAAKAARMKIIAVPGPGSINETCFDLADIKLSSLQELTSQTILTLSNY